MTGRTPLRRGRGPMLGLVICRAFFLRSRILAGAAQGGRRTEGLDRSRGGFCMTHDHQVSIFGDNNWANTARSASPGSSATQVAAVFATRYGFKPYSSSSNGRDGVCRRGTGRDTSAAVPFHPAWGFEERSRAAGVFQSAQDSRHERAHPASCLKRLLPSTVLGAL